jgi:hypothetical protein
MVASGRVPGINFRWAFRGPRKVACISVFPAMRSRKQTVPDYGRSVGTARRFRPEGFVRQGTGFAFSNTWPSQVRSSHRYSSVGL